MDIKKQFGQAVKETRKTQGISQEKLAELCGLHRTYITDVERGDRNVSLENIEKISNALKISTSKLFSIIEQIKDR